jgi:hypothetical protein
LLILQAAISDFWGKVFLAWQIYPAITVGYEQRKCLFRVIPAKAGIQLFQLVTEFMDSVFTGMATFYKIVNIIKYLKPFTVTSK